MEDTAMLRLRLIPYNARLQDTRKELGYTLKDLGLLCGFSSSYIGNVERLRKYPCAKSTGR